mmetsp:Transcript_45471/g.138274  ORF Transcript_45471/g.138274 Transcript_45471/m.138274 type:complete len:227 (-) Transcript_45471:335-1015(-)
MMSSGALLLLLYLVVVVNSFSPRSIVFARRRAPGHYAVLLVDSLTISNSRGQRASNHILSALDDDEDEEASNDILGSSSCNVLGTPLTPCCANVRNTGVGTGFYRNGYCSTGEQDLGRHTVCVQVTDEFLAFSASVGNDLSTPIPEFMFPGLKSGDIWCLCAQRWAQAYNNGMAPKLFLQATHEKTLSHVPIEILKQYAIDVDESEAIESRLNKQRTMLDKLMDAE